MKKTPLLLAFFVVSTLAYAKEDPIAWVKWNDDVFIQAKKEKKLVLLDLQAVWCHWCHVMEEKTYTDPKVIALIKKHYIAVQVDQDSRPDLANRYERYGWPATIIFKADGKELAKRSGYLPPKTMASILQAFVDNPVPGPSVDPEEKVKYSSIPLVTDSLRAELEQDIQSNYDFERGSWKRDHKLLDPRLAEYLFTKLNDPKANALKMATLMLDGQKQLLDPAWGGMYQYSTGGIWKEPHFEKIMSVQADNMRVFAEAAVFLNKLEYATLAEQVAKYVDKFLTAPDGGFYTSQDADLVQGVQAENYFSFTGSERRKQGVPKVDQNIYSRENGWMIDSLCTLYSVTGREEYLMRAVRAAQWILANRALVQTGGFGHDEKDPAGPYLADSAAMGAAFVNLYMVTADVNWLKRAESTANFIASQFSGNPGFVTAKKGAKERVGYTPNAEENILVARFTNLLHRYTGNEKYKQMAENSMKFLATPAVAKDLFIQAGVLLADNELHQEPVHIVVVGHKDDRQAKTLFASALKYPALYKEVEWWDKREGNLPRSEIKYPELAKAAAFACSQNRCSLPAFKAEDIQQKVDGLLGRNTANAETPAKTN